MIARPIYKFALMALFVAPLWAGEAFADRYLVEDQKAYASAVKDAEPGDTIVLKNGVWRDFEIVFVGEGTAEKPITLTAETKGSVVLSGQSNLRMAGNHLVVSGLVFKDGYTPTSQVISFRRNKDHLANNSRITEMVIDNYNNPERRESDFWVMMYGKNNRFDHNHLVGKRNRGVTMAVRLQSEASRENGHRIDHNYFGPRPILGSNGGETLRIGTSHYSLSNSNTLVENNYFDRTNGELEIISIKSGGNILRGNVFFEGRGTLTMRHGNGNLIEDNVFFGNGKDHTGGIRVINADHVIRNNYMEGLKGYRFGGAFVVMNGVPNSPINRYHQVKNAQVSNNSIIDSDHIQLAAGSDQERSAVPVDSVFKNNLIANDPGKDVFTLYDDVSGIAFSDNVLNEVSDPKIKDGFTSSAIEMSRAETGLKLPQVGISAGVRRDLKPIAKEETGVSWYPKQEQGVQFGIGRTIEVMPGEDTLTKAIAGAKEGDIFVLADGHYDVSRMINIPVAVTIRSAKPVMDAASSGVSISYERTTLFEILDGGALKLYGLKITGKDAPDAAGNSVIRTSKYAMLKNYELIIDKCDVSALDKNHSYNFLTVSLSTFADNIEIIDSNFTDVTGAILKLDREFEDFGIYNAEYVTITGSTFTNVQGALTDFYRGGTDESTFGPHFVLGSSRLHAVGGGKRNKSQASVHLHGVQVSSIESTEFNASQHIKINHTVGEPVTKITGNRFVGTALPTVVELNSDKENTAVISDNEVEAQ
jgi:poly(beta-D-mannuronate) lyase